MLHLLQLPIIHLIQNNVKYFVGFQLQVQAINLYMCCEWRNRSFEVAIVLEVWHIIYLVQNNVLVFGGEDKIFYVFEIIIYYVLKIA